MLNYILNFYYQMFYLNVIPQTNCLKWCTNHVARRNVEKLGQDLVV